jgi:maleate isomerase
MARMASPLEGRLSVHFSRFRVVRIAEDARGQFELTPMLEAARLLTDAKVDGILWSGTSAAWEGLDKDQALVEAIERELGVPATTSTLALLEATKQLGVGSAGLVVPYIEAIWQRIITNLKRAGLAVIAVETEGRTDNASFADIDDFRLKEMIRTVAQTEPECVIVHCTGLRAAGLVAEMEGELGIPILDSVAVGMWGAMRMLDLEPALPGWGRLLDAVPSAV